MKDPMKRGRGIPTALIASFLLVTGGGASAAAPGGFPVTVENCGRQLTFDRPPQRAITGYPNTIEMMLALDLEDRIVARQGFPQSPLLPDQEAAFNAIPEISSGESGDQTATKEVTLSLEPDFFFAGGSYNVDGARGLATEEDLEANGAQVFYMACTAHGTSNSLGEDDPRPTIEVVYNRIEDIGKIFGVPDRAEALIAQIRAEIAAVQERVEGLPEPPVFVYAGDYLGPEGPLPGQSDRYFDVGLAGGMDVLGADRPEFTDVSKEAVAAFNPEVILTANYATGPIEEEASKNEEYLRRTFPNAPAVTNDRIVGMESIDFTPGIRNVRAVRQAAEAFHPEAFE